MLFIDDRANKRGGKPPTNIDPRPVPCQGEGAPSNPQRRSPPTEEVLTASPMQATTVAPALEAVMTAGPIISTHHQNQQPEQQHPQRQQINTGHILYEPCLPNRIPFLSNHAKCSSVITYITNECIMTYAHICIHSLSIESGMTHISFIHA